MDKSGVLKTKNGHIEFYIDSDEKYEKGFPMLMKTQTNDGKLLLKLDPFDIFSLYQVLDEYVKERQFRGSQTLSNIGKTESKS